jgi:hypothetical protein
VRQELDAAAADAPDEPLPSHIRLVELERDPDVRRERAEALVQRFPGSAEARVLSPALLRDDGGPSRVDEKLPRCGHGSPDNVDALTAHAIEEVRSGNAAVR